ncbi:serine hydrolase domain-containing protein [Microbacterium stercoris]|uniref:Beta-lactamase family protein n=1 Tax=Microbacterium stercoris TaxID=2820289 RepID=A0A939QQB5_9MICO|nr:serine hydrolase domain-containing protein [Microbacterium stercoris]MBO3662696.1 beta-lactamase family protein [Microbacterium stercoris]
MSAFDGVVEQGFGRVADAFADALDASAGGGAALSVRVGGRTVIDVWGGRSVTRPWRRDTASVIFSCTKGLVAILAAQLVADGRLSYADPVVAHWPEFAAAGKEGTTVGDLLSHRAGLLATDAAWTRDDLTDWSRATALLSQQAPLWEPGSAHAYHPITHGWLAGEVIRRIAGRSVGEVFATRIAEPLRASAWIGLPDDAALDVAEMHIGDTLRAATEMLLATEQDGGSGWPARAMTLGGALPPALVGPDDGFNDPAVRRAAIPGAGGIATASALAAIWSATVVDTDGVRLLEDDALEQALRVRSAGAPFFPAPEPWPRWGMGFQLDSEARRYLTPRGFGHDGAGGQVAFADPELGVGFAFLTSVMEAGDSRGTAIVDALREAL